MSGIVNNISQRVVDRVDGCYLYFMDEGGDEYEAIDACAGATVSCVDYGNDRVTDAITAQVKTVSPLHLAQLRRHIQGLRTSGEATKGHMTRITTATSGEELKLIT